MSVTRFILIKGSLVLQSTSVAPNHTLPASDIKEDALVEKEKYDIKCCKPTGFISCTGNRVQLSGNGNVRRTKETHVLNGFSSSLGSHCGFHTAPELPSPRFSVSAVSINVSARLIVNHAIEKRNVNKCHTVSTSKYHA